MSIFKRKEVIYLWQIKDGLPVESGTQGRRNSVRNAGVCRQRMRTHALKTRKTSERMRKRDEESGIYRPWHQ